MQEESLHSSARKSVVIVTTNCGVMCLLAGLAHDSVQRHLSALQRQLAVMISRHDAQGNE